eukprot:TRINITY_DN8748_c1_g6_i2.p1 TRINITY_DN8748_c1_g6~~TRINITY_DN8748_c1_g6_i2.p1  ORF type:complete len:722 (-),score=144.40 TRINITY_DN8748_c1_g6_i2:144-2309(-)
MIGCRLEVQSWDLAVVRLNSQDIDASQAAVLLDVFADVATNAQTSFVAAVHTADGHFLVMPRNCAEAAGQLVKPWIALEVHGSYSLAALVDHLAGVGVESLPLELPDVPAHALLRLSDLTRASAALVAAGFVVGPASTFYADPTPAAVAEAGVAAAISEIAGSGAKASGVFCRRRPGGIEEILFETGIGVFVDLRIPNSVDEGDEDSCCGVRLGFGPTACGLPQRHTIVALRSPPFPDGSNTCHRGYVDLDSDVDQAWDRFAEGGVTAVLELVPGPSSKQRGYWIFAGGFFGRVTGPAFDEGIITRYFCKDVAQLRRVCGAEAFDAELHGRFDAVLGRVENPGLLRVLRRSWADERKSSGVLYDAQAVGGGFIQVDKQTNLVVHRFSGGGEQRWRILSMCEDPFTPPGGRLPQPEDTAEDPEEDSAESEIPVASNMTLEASLKHGIVEHDKRKRGAASRSPSIVLFLEQKQHGDENEVGQQRQQQQQLQQQQQELMQLPQQQVQPQREQQQQEQKPVRQKQQEKRKQQEKQQLPFQHQQMAQRVTTQQVDELPIPSIRTRSLPSLNDAAPRYHNIPVPQLPPPKTSAGLCRRRGRKLSSASCRSFCRETYVSTKRNAALMLHAWQVWVVLPKQRREARTSGVYQPIINRPRHSSGTMAGSSSSVPQSCCVSASCSAPQSPNIGSLSCSEGSLVRQRPSSASTKAAVMSALLANISVRAANS